MNTENNQQRKTGEATATTEFTLSGEVLTAIIVELSQDRPTEQRTPLLITLNQILNADPISTGKNGDHKLETHPSKNEKIPVQAVAVFTIDKKKVIQERVIFSSVLKDRLPKLVVGENATSISLGIKNALQEAEDILKNPDPEKRYDHGDGHTRIGDKVYRIRVQSRWLDGTKHMGWTVLLLEEPNYELRDRLYGLIRGFLHDIKSPFSLISTAIYILESMGKEAKFSETQKKIYDNQLNVLKSVGPRLDQTADLYLGVENASGNEQTATATSIAEIINRVAPLVFNANNSTQFHIEADKKVLGLVIKDADVSKIILNLLSNADKYSGEEDGKKVEGVVTLRIVLDDQTEFLVIEVEDNGVGIKEGDKKNILRGKTGQIVTSKAIAIGSQAMGLPSIQAIAKQLGGELKIKNQAGKKGSTFQVLLPMMKLVPQTKKL